MTIIFRLLGSLNDDDEDELNQVMPAEDADQDEEEK